ncbi:OsmC family protein [Cocleimonas sp. KMM 6892]|jgi:putative redox protein|uniref:OsmC family protein n=1 Tax=unclassified Cocleimonas TaxID=2639732 RepID=UPI002DB8893C|nr:MULTISPECIES: OsmC family protein [unclassified Cocleimonas]MEB8434527.1 OsmC family protein [Cocleimonas sp. KMM 6892]MEC4717420.1 OsmC family protein [Cocleimonas sp. KMM 6895]MEC4746786.1 OsmC family protein [Cocleimonas sp. KMM 6896]
MKSEAFVESTDKRYTQTITTGNHTLIADEPTELGGDDKGPAPFDYLLSALGSCTSITLSMYAERKNIQLDVITVRLTYIPPNEIDGSSSRIIRKIHLEGDFTDEQEHRMLEIADRCPIHKTLRSNVDIMSSFE